MSAAADAHPLRFTGRRIAAMLGDAAAKLLNIKT
jgi:hypothetical protein